MGDLRDYKKDLEEDLPFCRQKGLKVTLVEANPEKGFSYSYFVYIPNNPQNTIMVGDRLENDIAPARQLGMKTIWVRQGFAKYQSVEKECEKPDYIIENIGEIVKVLMGRT